MSSNERGTRRSGAADVPHVYLDLKVSEMLHQLTKVYTSCSDLVSQFSELFETPEVAVTANEADYNQMPSITVRQEATPQLPQSLAVSKPATLNLRYTTCPSDQDRRKRRRGKRDKAKGGKGKGQGKGAER